jgi:hypothetical protein
MSKPYIHSKTGATVSVADQPVGEWTDAELRKRGYVPAAEYVPPKPEGDDDGKDGKDGKGKGGKGAK